jgi:DNA replication initiation complex subunit (GINS family)
MVIGVFLPPTISTEFLFSLLQQEKATGELQQLQHDFYSQANSHLFALSKQPASEDAAKQLENSKKLLSSLKDKRRQKILLYIAYNKPLPPSVPEEEESLYNEIFLILNKNNTQAKVSKLKITSDIPEVLTSKGNKIGPFKQGEVVEISSSNDVEFIIKNKIGEIVV